MSALPPPILVADATALSHLVADLAASPTVAVDTESNSLHAYRERVCLIQFSTSTAEYIVDPIALSDLTALAPFFASPSHEKIFHAAEGDLLGLGRDFQFTFANIFDTMSAARTLGWPQVGLAAVLKAQFDVTLSKTHQRADWGRRPLRSDMLDYARLDTHYLAALRDRLFTALTESGRWPEALEDFERVARTQPPAVNQTLDPQAFWRVKGARDLTPQQAAVLRAVYGYRDGESSRTNQPPFKVIGEPTLLDIAQRTPHTLDDLTGIVAMTPGQIHRHGRSLLRAVEEGRNATPPAPPVMERIPDDVRDRYDRVQDWRKKRAQARGVESDVVLLRSTMWDLARRPPRTLADLEGIADFGPVRRAMYGQEIMAVVGGR
ncbi:MAG: HRDC domain-containing protein [Acidobacteria bacterium]|nr:HRDC domain-containing protein [Acidobacteriota bacterium]